MMKILVLGGTGFIGPAVVHQFVQAGHSVTIFHRGQREVDLPRAVQHLHGERRLLATFAGEFHRIAPEVVVDMRPMTQEDARGLVETFAGVAERCVVISSSDVYRAYGRLSLTEPGPPEPVPITEAAPLRGLLYADRNAHPHDRAENLDLYDKILVEQTVRAEPRLHAVVLRLAMVYGPRSYRHYRYLKPMIDQRPAIVLDEELAAWRQTPAYVENIAAAIILAATNPAAVGGTYNVGDADSLSLREVITHLAAAANWKGRIVSAPRAELPEPLQADDSVKQDFILDTAKIRAELDYRELVDRDTAIGTAVRWLLSHPPSTEDPAAHLQQNYDVEDAFLRR
jgi:nucleoside-diphosphate-sugar epimerase